MIVRMGGPTAVPELVDPQDCKRFHVEYGLAGAAPGEVAAMLGSWADGATESQVWVRIDAVKAAATGRVDDRWEADFAAMIAFATSKGWVNEAGDAIAAHIETPGGERSR